MKSIFITLIFLCPFFSCEKQTSPLSPIISIPAESFLKHITIRQTDYDTIQVTTTEDFILKGKYIQWIFLGTKQNDSLTIISRTHPVYKKENDTYKLSFNLESPVPSKTLHYKFTLRFILSDNQIFDIDTLFTMCKYPYESAEIYLEWHEIVDTAMVAIQDFGLSAGKFYYHPFGPIGLFQYDFQKDSSILIYDYPGGDFFALDSSYIFIDVSHDHIFRYNLHSEIIDTTYDLTNLGYYLITGMEAYGGKLYVLALKASLPSLLEFDYDLNLLGERSLTFSGYSFTIANNFLFILTDWPITLVDLTNLEITAYRHRPSYNTETIRIWDGYLYFNDFDRKYIGRISVNKII
ncbi:MAG: hypothetical protein Kow0042_16650 [Calditrichia bacterium]